VCSAAAPLFRAASAEGSSIQRDPAGNRAVAGAFGNDRRSNEECGMGKLTVALIVVVVLAFVGGGVVLAFWNIPAPSKPVEKVLPDARFPK
jgi:hypothetical protein